MTEKSSTTILEIRGCEYCDNYEICYPCLICKSNYCENCIYNGICDTCDAFMPKYMCYNQDPEDLNCYSSLITCQVCLNNFCNDCIINSICLDCCSLKRTRTEFEEFKEFEEFEIHDRKRHRMF